MTSSSQENKSNKTKISALQVKELRERTGAGILDSKKALENCNGDIEKSIKWLQEKGVAKAAKKSGRIAAEGLIAIAKNNNDAVIVEVNSETDFVALNKDFQKLSSDIANELVKKDFKDSKEASNIKLSTGNSINDECEKATAKIGEKIVFRRAIKVIKTDNECLGIYVHVNGKIGSIVKISGANEEIAKNIAMHVSAMNPQYLNRESMPKKIVENYKAEILKDLKNIDKPDNIKEKMAEGKLNKVLSELTLVDQAFVMENKLSVKQYLKNNNSEAKQMVRFEVGEGIEKNESNFAEEVANQMKG